MATSKLYGYSSVKSGYVDHNGNYGDYTFLEDPKSVLYGKQSKVPQLPLPSLEHTLDLFLKSVKPFCKSAAEFAELEQLSKEMLEPTSFTRTLHARLVDRAFEAKQKNTSWFVNWWNQWAYLQYRDSVVHNVTYELLVRDECQSQMNNPTRRAARFAFYALKYRKEVVLHTLTPDMGKELPWENSQHKYLFNCCRMPGKESDFSRTYAPDLNPHLLVCFQNRFFKLSACVDDNQNPISVDELQARLNAVVKFASSSSSTPAEVGILTAMDRDSWFLHHQELKQHNGEVLEAIQSAMFVICLDLEAKPVSRREVARHMLHGNDHASNRYWDKSFQIVVTGNGKLGYVGEHSMTDGTTSTRMVNFVLDRMFAEKESALGVPSAAVGVASSNNAVQELTFQLTPSLNQAIAKGWKDQREMSLAKEFEVLMFYGFGADKIKQFGVSPDAFAQVAIQLANYKVFQEVRGTYESTQTRTYMHGRTEVTRSVTMESDAFCKLTTQANVSKSDLSRSLHKACASHSAYTKKASAGMGCDRHLLGLKMACLPGEVVPALLTHPITVKSGTWQLSTSGLSGEFMDGWCFGEVTPQGVGIGYSVQKKRLRFSVSSCHVKEKWAEKMCAALEESLVFMASVCEESAAAAAPKSKL